METILLSISTGIFVAYVIFVMIKFGIQKSISESYYRFPNSMRFIFTLALWGFAIPIIMLGGISESVLLFLAGGFIVLVGAAPAFKGLLMEYKAHMLGAYTGILLGLTSLIVDFGSWEIVAIAVVLAILLKIFSKNYIWWIEILAFFTILVGRYLE